MSNQYHEAPRLESALATLGILGAAGLSGWINFQFWAGRGDEVSAWLTACAHFIAVGGFSMFVHHLRANRWLAAGAAAVTLLAAGWCAASMFEKLNTEAHARAIAAAQALPSYVTTAEDLAEVRERLTAARYERAPSDLGPLNRAAWDEGQARRVAALATERDRLQERLDGMIPEATIDPLALGRGVGVELATLIGLAVFGFGFTRRRADATEPALQEKSAEEARVISMKEAAAALGRKSGEARRAKAAER